MRSSVSLKQSLFGLYDSGEVWRYFVAGPSQKQGRLGSSEGGYFRALLDTLVNNIDLISKPTLDIDDFHRLHAQSLLKVTNTNYRKRTDPKYITDLSDTFINPAKCRSVDSQIEFPLTEANTSLAGLQQLLAQLAAGDNTFHLSVTTQARPPLVINSETIKQSGCIDKCLELFGVDEFQQVVDRGCLDFSSLRISYIRPQNDAVLPATQFERLIAEYNKELARAGDDSEAILVAIARFCNKATQLQPYLDGNGRIFCMLAPYMLCMQNNMLPPLMKDSSMFRGHAVAEIVAEMKTGMTRTKVY
ncbi:MAG: Fic family protein [Coxiellaceae bacterium]|nr:Fic family protein [Coxiellaceae bacterium]